MAKTVEVGLGEGWAFRKTTIRFTIAARALVIAFLFLAAGCVEAGQEFDVAHRPGTEASTGDLDRSKGRDGLIYGRITMDDGAAYEGRLRFGGDEEAFWSDYFNGYKDQNPWAEYVDPEHLVERHSITVFGFEILHRERDMDLGRPFMGRFGDTATIETKGRDIWVTLRSGTAFNLDRYSADDLADGLRIWDVDRGVVDLGEWGIRRIEFLPTAEHVTPVGRLFGTVHTAQGKFTGFLSWNREKGGVTDEITGLGADSERRIRFDAIRSIARVSGESAAITMIDGREILLSGTPEVGRDNRGVYVDDHRYGRVLVSWDAFERVDLSRGENSPAYSDFPAGLPLTGRVTTSAGNRLVGRLVFDLDESETTETLDAPSRGVDYTIPFGLIASIEVQHGEDRRDRTATVFLQNGEELQLAAAGDLGDGNAGMLIFVDDRARPEYLKWTDIERIDFDRPTAMYPRIAKK